MVLLKHLNSFVLLFFAVTIYAQPLADRHTTSLKDGWLSCTSSNSPNPIRGNCHWIRYDLGNTYSLHQTNIWNFNTPRRINTYGNEPWYNVELDGELNDGLRDVIIDYSIDGIVWKEWGRFTIPKANGSSTYLGSAGPNFNGIIARYILINGVNNYGGNCYGLSEIKMKGTIANVSNTTDLLKDANLIATPNPMNQSGVVTINGFPRGNLSISVVDSKGSDMHTHTLQYNGDELNYTLSTFDWPAGVYFFRVVSNGQSKSIAIDVVK